MTRIYKVTIYFRSPICHQVNGELRDVTAVRTYYADDKMFYEQLAANETALVLNPIPGNGYDLIFVPMSNVGYVVGEWKDDSLPKEGE